MKPTLKLPLKKNAAGPPKKTPEYFLNRAIKLLSFRPRSVFEISTRLRRAGAEPSIINQIIAKLTDLNLLDDLKFAQWWVAQRVNASPRGNIALNQELSQKGLGRDTINQVLLSFEAEIALAEKLPAKKRLSRGFSWRVVDALGRKE